MGGEMWQERKRSGRRVYTWMQATILDQLGALISEPGGFQEYGYSVFAAVFTK
jgi:hypothetical protein